VDKVFNSKLVRGFSLIELMLVLALVTVVLSLSAPSMSKLLHANRIRTEANRLMAAVNLARSEAISRNSPVSLCPASPVSSDQPVCAGQYAHGWMVFSNDDRDRVVDTGADQVIAVFEGLPDGYSLTNRAGDVPARELITYLPDGSSRRNRTLMFCAEHDRSVASRSVVMNIVGRPRISVDRGLCL
jgi:type IV fimbrial biogenesis protein FimT